MTENIIEALKQTNKWWKGKFVLDYKNREVYNQIRKFLPERQIIALTGLRRVGKTTLMLKIVKDYLDKGFDSEKYDGQYNNKFYYFGKFDGGFVLKPVLSNLQVISFKYIVSPIKRAGVHWTIYTGFYQTLKIWATGPISDELSDLESPIVGSEIDVGMMINAGPYFTLGVDFGVFIPELAYSNKEPRFRMGASLGFTF